MRGLIILLIVGTFMYVLVQKYNEAMRISENTFSSRDIEKCKKFEYLYNKEGKKINVRCERRI